MAADTQAAEAIEAAAENAAAIVAAAEQRAEIAIENAAESIATTEQLAQDLAAAALEGERGRQMEDIRKEVATWREQLERNQVEVTEVRSTLSEIQMALAAIQVRQEAPIVLTPQSSVPLPTPTGETLEIQPDQTGAVIVEPENQQVSDAEAVLEEVAVKPILKRRIWT